MTTKYVVCGCLVRNSSYVCISPVDISVMAFSLFRRPTALSHHLSHSHVRPLGRHISSSGRSSRGNGLASAVHDTSQANMNTHTHRQRQSAHMSFANGQTHFDPVPVNIYLAPRMVRAYAESNVRRHDISMAYCSKQKIWAASSSKYRQITTTRMMMMAAMAAANTQHRHTNHIETMENGIPVFDCGAIAEDIDGIGENQNTEKKTNQFRNECTWWIKAIVFYACFLVPLMERTMVKFFSSINFPLREYS